MADQHYDGQREDNFGEPDLLTATVDEIRSVIVGGLEGEAGWGVSEKAAMAQVLLVDSHFHLWSQIGYLSSVCHLTSSTMCSLICTWANV